jgi:hypothetical protein
MADLTEPKKETVRITLPPQPEVQAPKGRDTVRINLPSRPPTNGPAPATPLPMSSPKKETARITILPDPPPRPAVEMKKTQPLIDLPVAERPRTQVILAPEPKPIIESIPKPLCWTILGISTAILIIEIWSYFS